MKSVKWRGIPKKKTSLLTALVILAALALLFSGGAVTLAKYIASRSSEVAAVARPFYFTSDKLEEGGAYYQLDSVTGDSVKINFQLLNYVDDFRCTDVDFTCNYTVTTDAGTTLATGSRSFTGGTPTAEGPVSLDVDALNFEDGRNVTVTATVEQPYKKTISAKFGFAMGQQQLSSKVTEQEEAVVLELGGGDGGSVTVGWPATLIPDRSNPTLSGAAANSVTFTAESGVRYAFTFLKSDAALHYSETDFTITENETA